MSELHVKYKPIKSNKKIKVLFFQKINKFNNFILLKLFLFFIHNIIFTHCFYITIKVNNIGNQQVISDDFAIENYYPYKITVNTEGQILREKKVYVYSIEEKIKIEWKYQSQNLTYMFANLSTITSIEIGSEPQPNTNISHIFFNCINLQNFSVINNNFEISDMSYAFYNCHSMKFFSFKNFKFSRYIDLSYIFYNCTNLINTNYNNNGKIKVNNMKYSFYNCFSLNSIDLNNFITENAIDLSYAFYNCHSLVSLYIEFWYYNYRFMIKDMRYLFYNNTSLENIRMEFYTSSTYYYNMSYSFYNCINLKRVGFGGWRMRPNDMRSMFYNCSQLNSLYFELYYSYSSVNMTKMFFNCNKIRTINFDSYYHYKYYPNDLHAMFYNCTSLTNIHLEFFNTEKVLDMSYMFYNCKSLINYDTLNNFNTKQVKSLRGMFENCTKLTSFYFPNFNTPNLEIMWAMFKGCTELDYINLENFDTSKVTDMESMFEDCTNLISLNLSLNTARVQYMNKMFKNCDKLQYLHFPNINTSSIGTMHQMFFNCQKLKYLNLFSLTDRGQSVFDMFKFSSQDFVFCIKEEKDIPNIFNLLLNLSNTKRDCSNNCYEEERVNIPNKKLCCPFFRYGDTCVDKCPRKTNTNPDNINNIIIQNETNYLNELNTDLNLNSETYYLNEIYSDLNLNSETNCLNETNITNNIYTTNTLNDIDVNINIDNNRICRNFYCSGNKYYNYEQDDCITWPIEGYYINDTESKTIDKCHSNCSSCKGKPIEGNMNCKTCKEGLYIYLGNCYNTCLPGKYEINGVEICKCFNEKCLDCTEDSLEFNLCISCNTKIGFYPKSDEDLNISNFIDCYNLSEKYYLDNSSEIYRPCYPSCKTCYELGTYDYQKCRTCDSNFSVEFPISDNLYNCYPSCPYYYYFDDNNSYYCTPEEECPLEYSKLIDGEKQCVKDCSTLTKKNKTKEYRKTCYQKCPVEEKLLVQPQIGNICRAKCPNFEEPFEIVEKQICVSNCTIMERNKGKCVTNYYGNRTNAEVQDKVFSNIMDDIVDSFDYKYINDYTSIVLREKDHTYEIITTNSKVNNYNTSKLNLKNCEDTLKAYYGIDKNESLYILKLDAFRPGQTGPTVEYQLYYPFNKLRLEQLDLTVCEGQGVSLLINANITGGEDMYNKNSGYYNDICYTFTSGSGTDLTLTDRQDEFANNNQSLCEEGCEFVKYHYDSDQAECSCDVKTNVPLVSEIKVDKDKLYDFIDIKKIANFDVMKCYNLLLSIDGVKENIGFYVFFPAFLMYFIAIIYFYIKDFKYIKQQINEIVFAKRNLQYLANTYKPPEEVLMKKPNKNIFMEYLMSKKIDIPKSFGFIPTKTKEKIPAETSKADIIENKLEININIDKKSKKNKRKHKKERIPEIRELANQENYPHYKTIKIEKKSKKNKKLKNKTIFNNDIYQEKNSDKNNSIGAPPLKSKFFDKSEKKNQEKDTETNNKKNDLLDATLDSEEEEKKNKTIYFTEKQKQKIRDILKHNDDELNDLSYIEALKYDRRNFFQFYFALLKSKHLFIAVIESRDYNSRIIKIFLCFYSFSFGYAVNALFFSDDTMHKIHEDGGNFNFWYQLPQIIYSTIISYILENFLNYLALSEDDIISLKKEKVIERVGNKGKAIMRRLHYKFVFFFIISFIFLLVFWYYISCFCAVYRNTQYHLIKDTVISFGTSLLYPFGMYLLPPIFRIPALNNGYSGTKAAMYKFSKLLLFF